MPERPGTPAAARLFARCAQVAVVGAGWWSQGWHLPHLSRNPRAELRFSCYSSAIAILYYSPQHCWLLGSSISAIVEPCDTPRSASRVSQTRHASGSLNPDLKTTKELSEVYGVPVFKSFDDFLASEQAKSTDGILIATSHAAHFEIGMKAMERFHIFMEKPMTTDLREAEELATAAACCEKIFMLNNTANFRPEAQRIHDLIQSRRLKKKANAHEIEAMLAKFRR